MSSIEPTMSDDLCTKLEDKYDLLPRGDVEWANERKPLETIIGAIQEDISSRYKIIEPWV